MYSDLHLHLWEVQFDYLWKLKVLTCLSKVNGLNPGVSVVHVA